MRFPLVYEINTRCWLRELAGQSGQAVTLGQVPEGLFSEWRRLGFTHIWLMGVWSSGVRARAKALSEPGQREAYSKALPDWGEQDVAGSPYAIAEYRVPDAFGGEEGLQEFRRRLHQQGLKLLLDFVPNHLGLDHRWLEERPELFVQSAGEAPGTFAQRTAAGPRWLAYGKDPYFAAWNDTVQLDYRLAATQAAMSELLAHVAARCDGVRCDMAMLLLADVFQKTWERFPASTQAAPEFWGPAIARVKRAQPGFLFLAEAYWGLEERLVALGFDFTYDKVLYDKLVAHDAPGVQRYLLEKPPAALASGAHFLENHDEPRSASLLSPEEQRAAAVLILGLPGLSLLHEGQLDGARLRVPVQIIRRFAETGQSEIKRMYEELLVAFSKSAVGEGEFALLRPRPAWPENPTAQNFILIEWKKAGPEFELVAVNLAAHPGQCYAPCGGLGSAGQDWRLTDLIGEQRFIRSGAELKTRGLYLDLPAHGAHLFHCEPSGGPTTLPDRRTG